MRSSHAAYRPELRRTGDPRLAPLPPGDRPPAERVDGGAAARAEHPDTGRAGTDSGLCVSAQRLPALLVVPLCVRRGPAAGGHGAVGAGPRRPRYCASAGQAEALMLIAAAVRDSDRAVTAEQVARARTAGATDVEIHDTVL